MRWRDKPCYVLLSAGRDPDEALLDWMRAHAQASGSPFYYQQGGEGLGYGSVAFQIAMAEKLRRGEDLW